MLLDCLHNYIFNGFPAKQISKALVKSSQSSAFFVPVAFFSFFLFPALPQIVFHYLTCWSSVGLLPPTAFLVSAFFHMQTKHLQLISPPFSVKLSGKTNFLFTRRCHRSKNTMSQPTTAVMMSIRCLLLACS